MKRHRILLTRRFPVRIRTGIVRKVLENLLNQYGTPASEVSVLLTTDSHIRELNQSYRGVDEPTDVLSFSGSGVAGAPLGDIVISMEMATRQAALREVSLEEEVAFLAIHGGLHLLGYDDETEAGRLDMIRRMNEVALRAGLPEDQSWFSRHYDEHNDSSK